MQRLGENIDKSRIQLSSNNGSVEPFWPLPVPRAIACELPQVRIMGVDPEKKGTSSRRVVSGYSTRLCHLHCLLTASRLPLDYLSTALSVKTAVYLAYPWRY